MHTFRDTKNILLPREAMRRWLPKGRLGYSIEDLDCSLRLFSSVDQTGSFRLIENKVGTDEIGFSKEAHFAMYDTMLRHADPSGRLYKGYFVVNTPTDDWLECDTFSVNRMTLTQGQFRRWLWHDSIDAWLDFKKIVKDADTLDGLRLAVESSDYELIDVPAYKFKPHLVAAILSKLKKP